VLDRTSLLQIIVWRMQMSNHVWLLSLPHIPAGRPMQARCVTQGYQDNGNVKVDLKTDPMCACWVEIETATNHH